MFEKMMSIRPSVFLEIVTAELEKRFKHDGGFVAAVKVAAMDVQDTHDVSNWTAKEIERELLNRANSLYSNPAMDSI